MRVMKASFLYKRRIRFGETDPFGIAYSASYLNYFKEALDEFLRYVGFNPEYFYRNREKGYAFPIVSCHANFYKPLRYDDEIEIKVEVILKQNQYTLNLKDLKILKLLLMGG